MDAIFKKSETIPVFDSLIMAGDAYRFSTGRQLVTASGEYLSLHFHTPNTGKQIYYSFARISKTGAEVEVTLIEGGTYSGGTALTPWAMNRRVEYKDKPSGLTEVVYGISPDVTISGGIAAPSYVIPGASQGNVKSGGTSEGGFLCLEPDQDYTIKATTLDVNTYIDILANIAIFP